MPAPHLRTCSLCEALCGLVIEADDGHVRSIGADADVPVAVTDEMMPGVVSLPHGWGHARPGIALSVAAGRPGASLDDVTDELAVDALAGTAARNGVAVDVVRRAP